MKHLKATGEGRVRQADVVTEQMEGSLWEKGLLGVKPTAAVGHNHVLYRALFRVSSVPRRRVQNQSGWSETSQETTKEIVHC